MSRRSNRMGAWMFLGAYTASGLAALIYEVTWTRLLTLYLGHTTAATSTVLAAFMGGLAIGSAVAGRLAPRLSRSRALRIYAALEASVIVAALAIPAALDALAPLLAAAYRNGSPGALFPIVRVAASAGLLAIPAIALGASFPVAVRWFAGERESGGRAASRLYAVNTVGAAAGAIAAGFLLIPAIGVSGTTYVAVAASSASIVAVLCLIYATHDTRAEADTGRPRRAEIAPPLSGHPYRLALVSVTATGLATFIYEIAWTRVTAMIVGPTTYAFAATLTSFIAGLGIGAVLGTAVVSRTRRLPLALSLALMLAAVSAAAAAALIGGPLPRAVIEELATGRPYADFMLRHVVLVAALMTVPAICLGAAFPITLELASDRNSPLPRRVGAVYAVNTLAGVTGSLVGGFVLVPRFGLQITLLVATLLLLSAAAIIAIAGIGSVRTRAMVVGAAAVIGLWPLTAPGWDRELLASGGYKYAHHLKSGVDPEVALTAGSLLYYREGATGTVTVKRLTGHLSLAIDGKVDASTAGDMLTQKTLAHLPLLVHEQPREVMIVGLGSGVTLGSALVHPVGSVDVVEISPEVVAASRHFAEANRHALDDPRARLLVGDGRTHLSLSTKQYDVIISEPSNPWMAGVAALFTREFFEAAKDRLAPGGLMCQWAHTYDINPTDLRSIVATFAAAFPHGTMWLAGNGDLVLVGSTDPIIPRLANIATAWTRPGVAEDLRGISMHEPFALQSLFVGGPDEMRAYAQGGTIETDDRMALEFSGPLALNTAEDDDTVAALRGLMPPHKRPEPIAGAYADAGGREWRNRADMMLKADAYDVAYANYATAVRLDPADSAAASGLVRAAVAAGRQADAVASLRVSIAANPAQVSLRIALSRLLAATGSLDEAVAVARDACKLAPDDPAPFEQLASLYADAGDAARLAGVVAQLQRWPERAPSHYYAAAAAFLRGQVDLALAAVRNAINLDGTYAPARNLLGAIHASAGQTGPAREAFKAALALDPRDAATYANLGLLELSIGSRTAAGDLFAEALSLDPVSQPARDGLARAASQR